MPRTVFLWGSPAPAPTPDAFVPRQTRWWDQLIGSLSLSPVAARELKKTSRSLAGLIPDPSAWGYWPRPFRGLVVGAVQAGKTSSMMGLSAIALDQGYRLVV